MTVIGTAAVFSTSTSTTSSRAVRAGSAAGSSVGVGRARAPRPGAPSPSEPPPIGSGTTTSRVPSSNTASTFTSCEHVGDAGQHVVGAEHRPPDLERLLVPPAVARRLGDGVGDERRGLGDVEPQAAGAPRPRELGDGEQQEPVALGGGQLHGAILAAAAPEGTAAPSSQSARPATRPSAAA